MAAVARLAEAVPCTDLVGVTAAGSSGSAQPCQRWVDLGALPAAAQTAALVKKDTHQIQSVAD